MSVDMHCHLDLYPEPFKVAEECRARGNYVLSVTTTPKAWEGTRKLANGNQRIQTALGLHPQLAHQRAHEVGLFDDFLSSAKYVGEIGLDGSRDFKDHWEIQLKIFRQILNSIRRAGGRIMSIHSRSSASQVLAELKGVPGIPILHWFTGTPSQVRQAIDMGCWFSVGPAMLSTKSGRMLASMMPKERVLTETDGPFANFEGKPLLPWESDIAVKQLAYIWDVPYSEANKNIKDNFKAVLKNQEEF